MAVLIWVLTIFFMFIPGLVFYLLKKDDNYLLDQSKEAINWGLTVALVHWGTFAILEARRLAAALSALPSGAYTFFTIGSLIMAAVVICQLVFCIMGVIATSKGKEFRVPFALRLIK